MSPSPKVRHDRATDEDARKRALRRAVICVYLELAKCQVARSVPEGITPHELLMNRLHERPLASRLVKAICGLETVCYPDRHPGVLSLILQALKHPLGFTQLFPLQRDFINHVIKSFEPVTLQRRYTEFEVAITAMLGAGAVVLTGGTAVAATSAGAVVSEELLAGALLGTMGSAFVTGVSQATKGVSYLLTGAKLPLCVTLGDDEATAAFLLTQLPAADVAQQDETKELNPVEALARLDIVWDSAVSPDEHPFTGNFLKRYGTQAARAAAVSRAQKLLAWRELCMVTNDQPEQYILLCGEQNVGKTTLANKITEVDREVDFTVHTETLEVRALAGLPAALVDLPGVNSVSAELRAITGAMLSYRDVVPAVICVDRFNAPTDQVVKLVADALGGGGRCLLLINWTATSLARKARAKDGAGIQAQLQEIRSRYMDCVRARMPNMVPQRLSIMFAELELDLLNEEMRQFWCDLGVLVDVQMIRDWVLDACGLL